MLHIQILNQKNNLITSGLNTILHIYDKEDVIVVFLISIKLNSTDFAENCTFCSHECSTAMLESVFFAIKDFCTFRPLNPIHSIRE